MLTADDMAGATGQEFSAVTSRYGRILGTGFFTSPLQLTIQPEEDLQALFNSLPTGRDQYGAVAIGLMPGIYHAPAGVGGFVLGRSNVYLYSVFPHAAVLVDDTVGKTGGTLTLLADDSTFVNDVIIDGLTIVKRPTNAPCPALAIGSDTLTPPVPTTKGGLWNRITVVNCDIIGNHDGFQIFGNQSNFGSVLVAQNNRIYCAHDAFAVKAHGIIRSQGNTIYCNPTNPHPFIDPATIQPWKTTGFHISLSGIGDTTESFDPEQDYFESIGDAVFISVAGNIGGSAAQNAVSGYQLYNVANASNLTTPRCLIVAPRIMIDYNAAISPANGLAGINIYRQVVAAEGVISVQGGIIKVIQRNAAGPTNVDGIRNFSTGTGLCTLEVVGTRVFIRNDKGASNAFCAELSSNVNAALRYSIYSEQASSTAGGIFSAATIRNS